MTLCIYIFCLQQCSLTFSLGQNVIIAPTVWTPSIGIEGGLAWDGCAYASMGGAIGALEALASILLKHVQLALAIHAPPLPG